jgi:hypothetical protein
MFRKLKIATCLLIFGAQSKLWAQIPREVPHPNNNTPIDLSKPEDIILYIVLPLVFIILFFVGRKYRRKNR